MSLWLQAVMYSLEEGDYENFRVNLLPVAPIPIPGCMIKELEFAERCCRDIEKDRLFPIRFLWLLEANEQRLYGLSPLERSKYHPEKLLEVWNRAYEDSQYRQELEASGFQFNLDEKALQLSEGWIYIGDQFAEDFLEIEATLGVELLFSDPSAAEGKPAFIELKLEKSRLASAPTEPGEVF